MLNIHNLSIDQLIANSWAVPENYTPSTPIRAERYWCSCKSRKHYDLHFSVELEHFNSFMDYLLLHKCGRREKDPPQFTSKSPPHLSLPRAPIRFSTQTSKQVQKIFKSTTQCKFSHNHQTCTIFPSSTKLHLNSVNLVIQIKIQMIELFSE